ncbi:Peroxisomal membrane protein 14 [Cynara cardunculus var. scolymus]|uniref:Peroxisomal membrane protein PEX14 n=1 Tax=Cynara cardunculus var. scolymus TaxID=59895 RepID=A0A103YC26_CYNCS|nr:Peroxisomal membrane protein 14 [Cynara cardunculus var. scolymus]
MAAPPNPTDGNPQNPVPEVVKPTVDDQQDANKADAKETSIFVNTEPIREEQVQNAVKFLSHPKVKGSPVMYRRSFLERKGLTKEEIDEAFRRVPDESPSLSTTQAAVANQGGQSQPISNIQAQPPTQYQQPAAAAQAAPDSKLGTLTSSRFHWSHALLAVGVLAISGAGTAVVFKKRYFGELMSLLDMQVQEMKSMSNSIKKLEGQSNIPGREVQVTSSRPSYANGSRADHDSRSVRSLSPPPASVEPPHPKSYMEIMAMVQRGERPPNIRDINDLPPNPDQPVSNPRLAPKPKPWEAAQSQGSSTYPHENNNGLNSSGQDNGYGPSASVYQSNGDSSAPWWQQKNVRITEAEPEENKTGRPSERPVQRPAWVPPQPPPVAMAEAAAAIRQPKKSPFEKEQQLTDEEFLARSAEVTDELQRVTKLSESGGVSDIGGGSSVVTNTSEIQREEDGSYYEA